MRGICKHTGKVIEGKAHLIQSVEDILNTPIGSRVMRRDYGSLLPSLVDSPLNADSVADIVAAAASALNLWEPRFSVSRVIVSGVEIGRVTLDLEGIYKPDGKPITLDGIEIL